MALKLIEKTKEKLSDPLLTFKYFERLIAIFCATMPLILWWADGDLTHPLRSSISNYVYMEHSYIFGMLLCIAAMLFVFNGAVYYKTEQHLQISWHGQWYNIVLGLSLIGVICFPHKELPFPHYFFAFVFFGGNALVTGIFYKDKDKKKSITLAILTIAAMPFAAAGMISILVAEWISLMVISVHFVLSTLNLDTEVNFKKPKKVKPFNEKEMSNDTKSHFIADV